jgi:tRNA1(Val) A37 N6-methylase TrmN6
MEHLSNNITLRIPEGAFPLSTDSILLSDFVKLPRDARVLDLGSGCGTLGLMLCARDDTCRITGLELSECAHRGALENIERNALSNRMSSICADLRTIPEDLRPGSFHICISNPPYFSGGALSRSTPMARQDHTCSMEDLFSAAEKMLKFGGDFAFVHKPERLAELCACAARHKLEPKRLRLIRHRQDGPVSLILLSCRKGGKPGLTWEEEILFDTQGQPTPYYRALYHL